MSQPTVPDDPIESLVARALECLERGGAEALDELLAQHQSDAAAVRARLERLGALMAKTEGSERGQTIGPYRILARLGAGGMGVVYLADQREPVRRRVALKVIKLGMDSTAVLARFEAERKALAMMEHSCIATVFDAGVSGAGQPYFAMEYVKGIPLTDYCDQNRLSLKDRIRLFQRVCSGVQHAHLKGVMHRDLKPGNVLVTVQDGSPVPKIIDFGLAKATDHHLVEATIFTEQGQVIGTPEYMSPEQAGLGGLDVDTRTDVYSLGVLLYELLVGELPFSRQALREAGWMEMQRVIREQEPEKPSTKVTTIGDAASKHAAARQLDASALQRRLRGDLDRIVLKAIDKDRTRRYETAQELAADLGRYLEHEPVLARAPSVGYRLRKMLRKHRGQAIAAAVVLLVLVAGATGTFVQYVRAEQKAKEARKNAETASASAQRALDKAAEAVHEQAKASAAAARLAAKVREFDQVAAVVLYERAVARESELYPPWPSRLEAMEEWLREDCDRLLAMAPELDRTVRDLRLRAQPPTPEEIAADRRLHPRRGELDRLQRRVAALRHAQAVREGSQTVTEPVLPPDLAGKEAEFLRSQAWERVAPLAADRRSYGAEAFGLKCAREALRKVVEAGDRSTQRPAALLVLGWALYATGQDREAAVQVDAAVAAAPEPERERYRRQRAQLAQAIEHARAMLAAAEQELGEVTAAVAERWTFTFADELPRFLHNTLTDLQARLRRLAAEQKVAVERRCAWARRLDALTRSHPNARVTWAAAAEAIAGSPLYRQHAIPHLAVQMGLVPIGANPVTGLWEFYELRSAWDGTGDPAAIAIPKHASDGSIAIDDGTGIVFVLLPGGTFVMGAQNRERGRPTFDPMAREDEQPIEVKLPPFFLARHELTRGQWERLTDGNRPFWYRDGSTADEDPIAIGPTHPAESIDWTDADLWLRRHGLQLPTEAQWEYGCRGGRPMPWWTGIDADSLAQAANIVDLSSRRHHHEWGMPMNAADGFVHPCPVGRFRANGFGLYDVHGNVAEWCQDWYGPYQGRSETGDGMQDQGDGSGARVSRGGSFNREAPAARSACRFPSAPELRDRNLGVRAARAVRD